MNLRLAPALACATLIALTGCADPEADAGTPPHATVMPEWDGGDLGPEDGYTPPGRWLTLDDDIAAITKLDPDLRAALDDAAGAASEDGVEFSFTDGWRSAAYQQHLFDSAVVEYGSEEEASRWVKRADESNHVSGRAVDVATADAMDWLSRFGAPFGLCQIYVNESWHFEYVPGVVEECPTMLTDSTSG